MLHKHLQLGITSDQRFRFASLMSLAADDAGMPDDPEFVPRSSPISNGAHAWRSRTHKRRRRGRAGSGAPLGMGRSTALSAVGVPDGWLIARLFEEGPIEATKAATTLSGC